MFNKEKFMMMTPMKYSEVKNNQNLVESRMSDPNWIASVKRDGDWSMLVKDMNGNIHLRSRSISKVTGEYGNQTEKVPHIVKDAANYIPCGTVLIGELAFKDISTKSNNVGSILRSKPDKAVKRQQLWKHLDIPVQSPEAGFSEPLYFYSFDCLSWDSNDLSNSSYEERIEYLKQVQDKGFLTSTEFGEAQEILTKTHKENGEGIVLVRGLSKYSPGSRKKTDTTKVKRTVGHLELKVVSTIEPKKEYNGKEFLTWPYEKDGIKVTKPYFMGWKTGVICDFKGVEVRATSGTSDADAEWLASEKAQALIDAGELYAIISGMEVIQSTGVIRHPVLVGFRTKEDGVCG